MGELLKLEPRGDATVLALVAHDGKKAEMLALAHEHAEQLGRMELLATATTGTVLRDEVGLDVARSASGPEGGDLQIGAMISTGKVDAVIFLRDPLTSHPHEPDIQALLKICDIYAIPLATNVASARILLKHLSRTEPGPMDQLSSAGC